MKQILSLTALSLLSLTAVAAPRSAAETEAAVQDLLSRMTLEEKVGQLNQLSGYGAHPDMLGRIRAGEVGSLLNETDPAVVNRLQREAVRKSRLHIPLIFARDVIHGYKTIFPIPLGQAATWDADLVRQGARIAADEAGSVGIRWTFSPMVDISRDARWGRIAESFGEDPLLASRLGTAMVEGYQGDDLSDPRTMAACVKHFACYGAAEAGLDYNTTWVPMPLLRDVYLPPFKACSDAGAATFMVSFNDINGVPSSANRWLLKDLLRDEWGFGGLVVSDWSSTAMMVPQNYCADLREAAAKSANAGMDMDMESYAYIRHLPGLVRSGEVAEATVDSLCANVLRLKYRLGLFDNPYVDEKKAYDFYHPESLDAARRAVERSAVLLKNDKGLLPLDLASYGKVAVIGPMADDRHNQAGTWVFDLEKEHCVTPLEVLNGLAPEKIIYQRALKHTRDRSEAGFADARKAAGAADLVLFFAGEEAVLSGEAHCRTDLTLPGAQKELLRELRKSGKPIVMVVQAGRPLVIGDEADLCDAVLFLFHGGTMAGPGIVNVLTGVAEPGGRLPVSFARASGQMPLYYNRKGTGRPASGIVLIDDIPEEASQTSTGCTAFYLDAGDGPRYPFGYGLTYTSFDYSEPSLSADTLSADGSITVSCNVTNTGSREGSEVVQLYVRDLAGSLVRPVKELKDFSRVTLAPGETRTVSFTLPATALSFTRADGTFGPEPGEFNLWVASDSQSGTPVKFSLK